MKKATHPGALSIGVVLLASGCATFGARVPSPEDARLRTSILSRSQVWAPTAVRSADFKAGPRGADAFSFRQIVECDYVDKRLNGASPKFACAISRNDDVKVKFGQQNGEVYGEVLATRLLWGLGFGADRMYPVTVVCRGCPAALGGIEGPGNVSRFDPAVIERPMRGREWPAEGKQGWAWSELNIVNPRVGAPKAHRDALKLLAVFLQHTDSKPEQQRILCLDQRDSRTDSCRRPFLMISDVGLTFGRANWKNANATGSVNLTAWRQTPVWKDESGCVGNLPKSLTGSLDDPVISEEGRRFLAGLLAQLSDRQIRDLFEVARVELRRRAPDDDSSGFATVGAWVDTFKEKRSQILARRCAQGVPGGAEPAPPGED